MDNPRYLTDCEALVDVVAAMPVYGTCLGTGQGRAAERQIVVESLELAMRRSPLSTMPRASTGPLSTASLDQDLVERLYARFASVYDGLFGPILQAGRAEAMRSLPLKPGDEILEVGIGTGLTATLYPADCRVTGIDLSEPMLREAARLVASRGHRHVRLRRMDAAHLGFPDESFDVVYAAYVVSVVADPVAVLGEMRRVCRADGQIVLLNHFLSSRPMLSAVERWIAPLTARAGFRSDLDLSVLLAKTGLEAVSVTKVNTPSIWSLVHCRREPPR